VAADALARTPEMLPVLAQAGVVDAGGDRVPPPARCLLVRRSTAGHPLPEPSGVPDPWTCPAGRWRANGHNRRTDDRAPTREPDVGDLRYEVMYLLYAPDDSMADFKEVWAGIGDSIVVVGGDGLWNCHIHTDDIGPPSRPASTPEGPSASG
jgi:hypothetical protein